MLIEHTQSRGGYLYRLRAGELTRLRAIGVPDGPESLARVLTAFTTTLSMGTDDSTTGALTTGMGGSADASIRELGFKPLALYATEAGKLTVVALAALSPANGVVDIPLALRDAIASELVQLG